MPSGQGFRDHLYLLGVGQGFLDPLRIVMGSPAKRCRKP